MRKPSDDPHSPSLHACVLNSSFVCDVMMAGNCLGKGWHLTEIVCSLRLAVPHLFNRKMCGLDYGSIGYKSIIYIYVYVCIHGKCSGFVHWRLAIMRLYKHVHRHIEACLHTFAGCPKVDKKLASFASQDASRKWSKHPLAWWSLPLYHIQILYGTILLS